MVSLLFAAGNRPSADAVRSLSERDGTFSISLDPLEGEASRTQSRWLELLSSGLVFDLSGLAPGPPAAEPPQGRRLAMGDHLNAAEAVTLRPGPHLASGSRMMPVIRTLAELAASFGELPGLGAVVWHPARSWCGPEVFRDTIGNWIAGGVFPGLTLTTLAMSPDRGLHSEGLALFTGQELRLEPEIVEDRAEAVKLALRLFDILVERGKIEKSETLADPDGLPLRLEPSENGRFVRVCRG